jgi:predicted transcriptional regulator
MSEELVELARRASALAVLRDGALDRRELQERLGVSRPTVHRFTRSFEDQGLIERSSGELSLTPMGEVIAAAVTEFQRTVETAQRVEPVFEMVFDDDPAFVREAFGDATVTTAEPGDPYNGVRRFMSLVESSERLRGVDPTAINPLHLDGLHARIVAGMETDAIFLPDVVESLLRSNPDRAREAFESGNLTLRVHDDLPFGITLCDDRIGIGLYDDETGLLRTYIDTASPTAREWAEDVYADYRNEATLLSEHSELSELLPAEMKANG